MVVAVLIAGCERHGGDWILSVFRCTVSGQMHLTCILSRSRSRSQPGYLQGRSGSGTILLRHIPCVDVIGLFSLSFLSLFSRPVGGSHRKMVSQRLLNTHSFHPLVLLVLWLFFSLSIYSQNWENWEISKVESDRGVAPSIRRELMITPMICTPWPCSRTCTLFHYVLNGA